MAEADREALHQALIESLPLPYVAADLAGRILRWNRRYVEVTGLTPERLRDATLMDVLSAEGRDVLAGAVGELWSGKSFITEYSVRRPDGKPAHYHLHVSPLRDDDGAIVGSQALIEDITSRVQLGRALAENEAELRDLYENAPLAYYVLTPDRELRLIRWNGRVAELFGLEPSELRAGRSIADFFRRTDEADRALARAFEETATRGRSFSIEVSFTRLDGERRWVRSHTRPLRDTGGKVVAVTSMTEDITDIRRAEEALRESDARLANIVESATDAIISYDGEGHILLFNRGAERILRCSASEALGQPVARFSTEAGLEVLSDLSARLDVEPGATFFTSAEQGLRGRRSDGSTFLLEGTLSRSTSGGKAVYTMILRDVDERRAQLEEIERLRGESEYFQEELRQIHQFEDIVGRSPALGATLAQVSRVAPTDSTVLILGETGTGKEMIARAIHAKSRRSERPLVKINCAAVPAGLVESELFGHERGAFTGATERRTGRFELANGGTIFLDEIGELPVEAQSKLLRVLQEREFERVGGSATLTTDVRVIAATNRDLGAMVEAGRFRADLYYRLDVFPLTLPPLRERPEDIPLLANFFIARYASKIGRTVSRTSARAAQRLAAYAWPGNVRELENVIERALILASPDADTLDVPESVLSLATALPAPGEGPDPRPPGSGAPAESATRLSAIERAHVASVLDATGWRIEGANGAAARLGLKPSTLRSRMRKLGIRRG